MKRISVDTQEGKEVRYRNLIRPSLMDDLKVKINRRIVEEKKFLDKDYSALQLAKDLGTNTRYISAVVNNVFKMNYTSFINKYRIEEAMAILSNPQQQKLSMKKVSEMVGFTNRQSFYTSFLRMVKMTPVKYRKLQMASADKT